MQSFEETGLSESIRRAISEMGFEKPTPIQAQTIPQILGSEQDLVALAQTGTGKTAAFGLPIIQKVDTASRDTQVLVLCPTRELCLQISKDFNAFTKYMPQLEVAAIYGGAGMEPQIKALRRGAQVVVGTPGRVIDLMERGILVLSNIRWLVLDEADEMLNMGFKEDLDTILSGVPQERQTLLFSATMPREIQAIAENYMNDPFEISVGSRNSGADTVEHLYYVVNAKDRYLALKRIADVNPNIYGIIFCRTRRETQEVADKLIQDGYNADALHGDLSQAQREHVMNKFRSMNLQLLVATDVAARGLDVSNITHVINYNLPDETEVYIHRSGRTGRAGKLGTSISIIHGREIRRIKDIERILKKPMTHKVVPTGAEICEIQLFSLVDKMEKIAVDDHQIEKYLQPIYAKLENMSREDLIKRFVAAEFNRFLEYYKNAPDINVSVKGSDRERDSDRDFKRNGRDVDVDFQKVFLNLGTRDGLTKGRLMEFINSTPELKGAELGKIEVLSNNTFFEIDVAVAGEVEGAFSGVEYNGRSVMAELRSGPVGGGGGGSRGGGGGFSRGGGGRDRDRDRSRRRR